MIKNNFVGISSEEAIDIEEKQTSHKEVVSTSHNPKKSASAIERYKALLANLEEEEKKEKDRDVTLEISWEPGLKGKAESLLIKREKMKGATPFEEFLEKKKEKKKLRKEQKAQPVDSNESSVSYLVVSTFKYHLVSIIYFFVNNFRMKKMVRISVMTIFRMI